MAARLFTMGPRPQVPASKRREGWGRCPSSWDCIPHEARFAGPQSHGLTAVATTAGIGILYSPALSVGRKRLPHCFTDGLPRMRRLRSQHRSPAHRSGSQDGKDLVRVGDTQNLWHLPKCRGIEAGTKQGLTALLGGAEKKEVWSGWEPNVHRAMRLNGRIERAKAYGSLRHVKLKLPPSTGPCELRG